MFLLDDLLALPWSSVKWVMRQVADAAEHELNDDDRLREQLLELQLMLETGEMDEEEYVREETVILARLREIEERRRGEGWEDRL